MDNARNFRVVALVALAGALAAGCSAGAPKASPTTLPLTVSQYSAPGLVPGGCELSSAGTVVIATGMFGSNAIQVGGSYNYVVYLDVYDSTSGADLGRTWKSYDPASMGAGWQVSETLTAGFTPDRCVVTMTVYAAPTG